MMNMLHCQFSNLKNAPKYVKYSTRRKWSVDSGVVAQSPGPGDVDINYGLVQAQIDYPILTQFSPQSRAGGSASQCAEWAGGCGCQERQSGGEETQQGGDRGLTDTLQVRCSEQTILNTRITTSLSKCLVLLVLTLTLCWHEVFKCFFQYHCTDWGY